jgi:hypothetical protein
MLQPQFSKALKPHIYRKALVFSQAICYNKDIIGKADNGAKGYYNMKGCSA